MLRRMCPRLMTGALLAFAFTATFATAADAPKPDGKIDPKEDINVFVTKAGSKFHVQDCRTIAGKDATATPLSEAQKKLEPCSICKPLAPVAITASGKKYHMADCKLVGDKPFSVTLAYAKIKGYEPCKVCDPYGAATAAAGDEKDKKKDEAKK